MPPSPVAGSYVGVVVSISAKPWPVRRPFAVTSPRYGAVPVTSTGWPFGPSGEAGERHPAEVAVTSRDAFESSLL